MIVYFKVLVETIKKIAIDNVIKSIPIEAPLADLAANKTPVFIKLKFGYAFHVSIIHYKYINHDGGPVQLFIVRFD